MGSQWSCFCVSTSVIASGTSKNPSGQNPAISNSYSYMKSIIITGSTSPRTSLVTNAPKVPTTRQWSPKTTLASQLTAQLIQPLVPSIHLIYQKIIIIIIIIDRFHRYQLPIERISSTVQKKYLFPTYLTTTTYLVTTIFYIILLEMSEKEVMKQLGYSSGSARGDGEQYQRECLRWQFLQNIDFCSLAVGLHVGEGRERSVLGGVVNLGLTVFCLWLTYLTFFGSGIPSLNSQINSTKVLHLVSEEEGISVFANDDEPVGFYMINGTDSNGSRVSMEEYHVVGFEVRSEGRRVLNISQNCRKGTDFCLRKQDNSQDLKIYNYSLTQKSYLIFSICERYGSWDLNYKVKYQLGVRVVDISKNHNGYEVLDREVVLTQAAFTYNTIGEAKYIPFMFTYEQYETNNYLQGHFSNIFPSTHQFVRLSSDQQYSSESIDFKNWTDLGRFPAMPSCASSINLQFESELKKVLSKENFDDISGIVAFYFSVKETLLFLAALVLVKRYDENHAYLSIAEELFYVEDHRNSTNFNFKSGFQVYLACFLYGSFALSLLDSLLKRTGSNLSQFLPYNTYYTMLMIKKAQQMLKEDYFFNNLQQLSSLQDLTFQKITLKPQSQNQSQQPQNQQPMQYFANNSVKQYAFQQFCKLNQWASNTRKNHIYKILISKTFQIPLCANLRNEFQKVLKSVKKQSQTGLIQLNYTDDDIIPIQKISEQCSEIPINIKQSQIKLQGKQPQQQYGYSIVINKNLEKSDD